MSDDGIHNVIIESADLLRGHHGPELCIICSGDGWKQGFKLLLGPNADWAPCVWVILRALRVEGWGELEGKAVRVMRENDSLVAIGHIVMNSWFDLRCWKAGDPIANIVRQGGVAGRPEAISSDDEDDEDEENDE